MKLLSVSGEKGETSLGLNLILKVDQVQLPICFVCFRWGLTQLKISYCFLFMKQMSDVLITSRVCLTDVPKFK